MSDGTAAGGTDAGLTQVTTAAEPSATPSIPDPDGPDEPTRPRTRAVALALAAVGLVVVVALVVVSLGIVAPGGGSAGVPPSGDIWFGPSYDPSSLVLSETWTTSPVGQPIAVVAHLARPSSPRLAVTMTLDGSPVVATTIDVASGHEYVGLAPGSILGRVAGTWVVTISDDAGRLASGSLTVSP